MAHKCPNCSTEFTCEEAHGVSLEVCPKCGGIWLGPVELKALITGERQTLLDLEASIHPQLEQKHMGGSKLLCPVCEVLLEEYHYLYNSPVLIHTCTGCGGLFISADELPQMQQWYEKAHEPVSSSEELRIQMAADISNHEAFLMREKHLAGLFNSLRRTGSGWFGFFP